MKYFKIILRILCIAASITVAVLIWIWGINLPHTCLLWYHGQLHGFIELGCLSLIAAGFCMMPTFIDMD